MTTVTGYIKDKNKNPIGNARVALLNNRFEVEFSAESDENGYYSLKADAKTYPYFMAVKEYKTNFLEYWSYNVRVNQDVVINPKIDRLSILALTFFPSMDADEVPSIMVYFRPMSLTMFMAGERDIAPDINTEDITVSINGEFCEIFQLKKIREIQKKGVEPIKAYAIKLIGKDLIFNGENVLEVSATDKNGDYGEASLFF